MKIYLAIPYSFNPELSHTIVCEVAAQLMQEGHVVFSPISHGHFISDFLDKDLRTDSEWWMQHDLPFIDWADEVRVIYIGEQGEELINKSIGVQAEMEHARKTSKPISIIQVDAPPPPDEPIEIGNPSDNIETATCTLASFQDFDTKLLEPIEAKRILAIKKNCIDIVYHETKRLKELVNPK
jgi:hypothetical protein